MAEHIFSDVSASNRTRLALDPEFATGLDALFRLEFLSGNNGKIFQRAAEMLDDPRLGLSGEATELGVLDFTSLLLPKFADTRRSNQLLNKVIQLPTGQRDVATAWNQKWQRLLTVATLDDSTTGAALLRRDPATAPGMANVGYLLVQWATRRVS